MAYQRKHAPSTGRYEPWYRRRHPEEQAERHEATCRPADSTGCSLRSPHDRSARTPPRMSLFCNQRPNQRHNGRKFFLADDHVAPPTEEIRDDRPLNAARSQLSLSRGPLCAVSLGGGDQGTKVSPLSRAMGDKNLLFCSRASSTYLPDDRNTR